MARAMNVSKRLILPILGIILFFNLIRLGRTEVTAVAPKVPPATQNAPISAEGRVVAYPGSEVVVGSEVAGVIEELRVQEKDEVRQGQLIASLRQDDLRAAVAEARARVAEAEADVRLAESEISRAKSLWESEVGSRQAYDRAVRDREAATARLRTSRATVDRLEADLAKAVIRAPISGTVIERRAEQGETIDKNDPLVTIANLSKLRIEAEVDEFDASLVRLGNEVAITVDGYEGKSWRGRVEEIPDVVVGRKLKPEDPGRLSDTRVLLVKVALLEGTPLKLNQRVEVMISR